MAAPALHEGKGQVHSIHLFDGELSFPSGRFLVARLPLPKAVLDAALDVDRKSAVARDVHRRMGQLAARRHRRGDSRFDVVHQPVRGLSSASRFP